MHHYYNNKNKKKTKSINKNIIKKNFILLKDNIFLSKKNTIFLLTILVALIIFFFTLISFINQKNFETIEASALSSLGCDIVDDSLNNNILIVPVEETDENVTTIDELQNEEIKEDTNVSKGNTSTSSSNAYYIKINIALNVVYIYSKDENNEYSVPYKAMVCSTGSATPSSRKIFHKI